MERGVDHPEISGEGTDLMGVRIEIEMDGAERAFIYKDDELVGEVNAYEMDFVVRYLAEATGVPIEYKEIE